MSPLLARIKEGLPLEAHVRARRLVRELHFTKHRLAEGRAIEVLEGIATQDAVGVAEAIRGRGQRGEFDR